VERALVNQQRDHSDSESAQRALDSLRSSAHRSDTSVVRAVGVRFSRRFKGLAATSTARVVIVATGVVLIALVCAVLVIRTSEPEASLPASVPVTPSSVATTTTTGPTVVVDIGGAVRQPGVYRLSLGSRVVDALERAGGPAEDVDLELVNLAAPVTDGQRVWFARRGEVPRAVGSSGAGSSSSGSVVGPLDLNSATLEQLEALSGVGPATAKAILERRTQLGRFRSVEDLLTVKGIGAAKLDSIRASVVVR